MQLFTKTRIRLTAWYLVIIMVISVIFSTAVFQLLSLEVERFVRRRSVAVATKQGTQILPILTPAEREFIDEFKQQTILRLLVANAFVLLFSGGLGYMLAGKTLQPIKNMIEEQNRFISDASHELKTPLTSLQSGIEVFLRSKKQTLKEARILLEENMLDTRRLQKLSHSLLLLAQAPTKIKSSTHSPIRLDKVASGALKAMSRRMSAKKITHSERLEETCILGDGDELLQMIEVLLDNAIKYTKPNGTISLELKAKKRSALLRVIDSGPGIKQEDLARIFDRFYRTDDARTRSGDEDGYGLGLAIAKRIITKHGGTICARSPESGGAIFEVRLPCTKAQA